MTFLKKSLKCSEMIAYNEIKERAYIVLGEEPYEVLSSNLFRKQQRKPVNVTKLKHLITGKVIEHSFRQSDKVEEAQIDEREVVYLFKTPSRLPAGRQDGYWFSDKNDKSQRFKLEEAVVSDKLRFLTSNSAVVLVSFNNRVIGIKTPIKVAVRVKEAPPAVRGNTIQGGTKKVILETGAELAVPLFIKAGETITVNTTTGEYVSRLNITAPQTAGEPSSGPA